MPPNDAVTGKLGLLAGGGALPLLIRDACRRDNTPYFVVVFEGQGNPKAFTDDAHAVLRLGAAGGVIKALKSSGCDTLVMAGTIRRPSLKELRPDWWAAKFFATSGAQVMGDDGLLRALVGALESEGFRVVGADGLVPEYLMPPGPVGNKRPSDAEAADIAAAVAAAKALGARDTGQAAVVANGKVIAEEDKTGTDAMLRALAENGNQRGVLAKTLKPGQERRVDLPTVGLETLRNAHDAGLTGVIVEAGNAFLMDRGAAARLADELGLFLIGVDSTGDWT